MISSYSIQILSLYTVVISSKSLMVLEKSITPFHQLLGDEVSSCRSRQIWQVPRSRATDSTNIIVLDLDLGCTNSVSDRGYSTTSKGAMDVQNSSR
jgi:hypothetical protein